MLAQLIENRVDDVDVVHDVDEDAVGDAVDIVRDVGDVDYACDVDEVDVDGCRWSLKEKLLAVLWEKTLPRSFRE